jgi:hypothetical protein
MKQTTATYHNVSNIAMSHLSRGRWARMFWRDSGNIVSGGHGRATTRYHRSA